METRYEKSREIDEIEQDGVTDNGQIKSERTLLREQRAAELKRAKAKKIRKRILLVLFVLLNVGVIAWTAVSEFSDGGDAANLTEVNLKWWMMLFAAGAFILAVVAEIAKYYLTMRVTKSAPEGLNKKQTWRIAQRTVLLGRYYDNITPAAVGGQPFQIYYMHKSGVRNGYDAVIPLIGMITDQIGYLLIGMIAIVLGSVSNQIWSPGVVALGWIGLLCYAFFPLVILAATFLPRTTEEIMTIIIKFLAKIHIIKDKNEMLKKAKTKVALYADGIKTVLKTKGLFLKLLGLSSVYYIGLTMIPFFVLAAFGAEIGWFACFATTAAVSAAVYFVPTPGNAGAAEGLFYSVFSVLPQAGYVFWAMMFWRFFIYYMWLAMGGITQMRIYVGDKTLKKNWNEGVDKATDVIGKSLSKKGREEVATGQQKEAEEQKKIKSEKRKSSKDAKDSNGSKTK